jgi:hypothetical protein
MGKDLKSRGDKEKNFAAGDVIGSAALLLAAVDNGPLSPRLIVAP